MKTYLNILLILLGINLSSAQDLAYGLKAGTNFTSGGQITGNSHKENGEYFYWTGTTQAQTKLGFHGGAFLEMDFGDFFLRPELVYTIQKTEFTFPNKTSVLTVRKLDIPLLLGFNFSRYGGVYAGPVYFPLYGDEMEYKQSTIVSEEEEIYGNSLNDPKLPVNLQVGLKFHFMGAGVDVRYEYSLSKSQPEEIDVVNSSVGRTRGGVNLATVDKLNLSQLIVSLTYDISQIGSFGGRRGHSYKPRRRVR